MKNKSDNHKRIVNAEMEIYILLQNYNTVEQIGILENIKFTILSIINKKSLSNMIKEDLK